MFSAIGPTEILIIVLVLLLLFGGKELPKVIKSILRGWRDLQRTTHSIRSEINQIIEDDDLKG
ncbi:twin-arginine translocase TatA/TatE family subunit [bacterium]|nr:twin-arginine translocase TatA/TatE family subunit [bacterium]